MDILVIGTIGFDIIETPFKKTNKILGGSATFIGISASILKVSIHIISIVGKDFPEEYLKLLESKNIDIRSVEVSSKQKTFFWYGKYDHNMNSRDTLITELNVLKKFEPKIPKSLQNSDIILLGNLDPKIQILVLKQIKNPKLIILDTMNYWIENTWNTLIQVIKKIDMITINYEEARQLSKEYNLIKAIKKIHKMGPKFIIIKKGKYGSLLSIKGKIFFTPAFPIKEVIDPTGAGDTFIGGVASYLASNNNFDINSIKKAVIYGTNLASFCVENFGINGIKNLTEDKINKRLDQFKKEYFLN